MIDVSLLSLNLLQGAARMWKTRRQFRRSSRQSPSEASRNRTFQKFT